MTRIADVLGPELTGTARILYNVPGRVYHSWQHVSDAFDVFQQTFVASEHDRRLAASALAFHDAIYIPGYSPGSEDASAAVCRFHLQVLGWEDKDVQLVSDMILSTAAMAYVDPEGSLPWAGSPSVDRIRDCDISALSTQDYQTFVFNQEQLLLEHGRGITQEGLVKQGQFLRKFLALPFIYRTEEFRSQHEGTARHNIRRYLAGL